MLRNDAIRGQLFSDLKQRPLIARTGPSYSSKVSLYGEMDPQLSQQSTDTSVAAAEMQSQRQPPHSKTFKGEPFQGPIAVVNLKE